MSYKVGFLVVLDGHKYFREKTILTPTNEVVDIVNHMFSVILGEEATYLTCDCVSVCKSENNTSKQGRIIYKIYYWPKIFRMPNHKLTLKVSVTKH